MRDIARVNAMTTGYGLICFAHGQPVHGDRVSGAEIPVGEFVLGFDGFPDANGMVIYSNGLACSEIAKGNNDIVFGMYSEGLDGFGHGRRSMHLKVRVDKLLPLR